MTETLRAAVTVAWDVASRVEAVEETAVKIRNTDSAREVFYAIGGATVPLFDVGLGHVIRRGGALSLTLAAGEYLYLATGTEAIDVTLTTGAA